MLTAGDLIVLGMLALAALLLALRGVRRMLARRQGSVNTSQPGPDRRLPKSPYKADELRPDRRREE